MARIESRYPAPAWIIIFILLSAAYFYVTLKRSSDWCLWEDEVLAVTAAAQPTWEGVWKAIWAGTDFSPPTIHYFLHTLAQIIGIWDSPILWRIPSILGVFGAGICTLFLALRYLSPFVSLVAFGLVLTNELVAYAVQVRPYGLLSFGLGGALLIWEGFARTKHPKVYGFALWLISSLCLSLHFYGFIPVAAIGIAELLWLASRKQVRWGIWTPLLFLVPVGVAWTPLALHLALFNAADNKAPDFYGRPSIDRFLGVLMRVLLGGEYGQTLFFGILAVLTLIFLWRELVPRSSVPENSSVDVFCNFSLKSPFVIILISILLLPLITFSFSYFITGNFNEQYTVCASIGFGLATGFVLDRLPFRQYLAIAVLEFILPFFFLEESYKLSRVNVTLSRVSEPLEPSLPIVIEDGREYIELTYSADEKLRKTLVFLLNDPSFKSPDPTNENIVKRLAPFYPEDHLYDRKLFMQENRDFYIVFSSEHSMNNYSPWFFDKGWTHNLVRQRGGIWIYRVTRNE